MPSTLSPRLQALHNEWNALVPLAIGVIPGVRPWNSRRISLAQATAEIAWLRDLLGPALTTAVPATLLGPRIPRAAVMAAVPELTFGVEIETVMPAGMNRARLVDHLNAAGIPTIETAADDHDPRPEWKVKPDGSLPSWSGAEVNSPVLTGAEGFAVLRRVADLLKSLGCRITTRCGLHVHIGLGNRGVGFLQRLVRLYGECEPVIDQLVNTSRRNNRYAVSVRRWVVPAIMQATTTNELMGGWGTHYGAKFRKVNLKPDYGTVEFRQHQGTVRATEIEMWVRFVQRLVITADSALPETLPTTIDGLLDLLKVDGPVRRFYTARYTRTVTTAANRVVRRRRPSWSVA